MADRALVVGAGVVGLSCALTLTRRGFAVTLVGDPAAPSASSVAAGMLAPAAEAALDPDAPPYPLMAAALSMWPAFARSIGASDALHRCGSRLEDAPAPRASLLLDARIDVAAALSALLAACKAEGVRLTASPAIEIQAHAVLTEDRRRLDGEVVVLAAGWRSAALALSWPSEAPLTPVRGQLVRFAPGAAPADGPMLRTASGYLCPSVEGLVSGATMEPGVTDAMIDPAVTDLQVELARRRFPSLTGAAYQPVAGVRAAAPDNRPIVGRLPDGLIVATGMRRNGWLLAPLVADLVASLATGENPGPWAEVLSPARFSRSARS